MSLTSALSITRSVNPPRGAFVDYPLGHTAGKPDEKEQQLHLLKNALSAFSRLSKPGSILMLPETWDSDDSWKEEVMRPSKKNDSSKSADNRLERFDTPQYQCDLDKELAESSFEVDGCPTCVFLGDDTKSQSTK